MMFSERGVACRGYWMFEKRKGFYCFLFISDYTCTFFRTCSAFSCAAVQMLTWVRKLCRAKSVIWCLAFLGIKRSLSFGQNIRITTWMNYLNNVSNLFYFISNFQVSWNILFCLIPYQWSGWGDWMHPQSFCSQQQIGWDFWFLWG